MNTLLLLLLLPLLPTNIADASSSCAVFMINDDDDDDDEGADKGACVGAGAGAWMENDGVLVETFLDPPTTPFSLRRDRCVEKIEVKWIEVKQSQVN